MHKDLRYFILGLLSGVLFLPLLEELGNVLMSWIQVLMLKPTKIVLKGNQEIADLQSADEPVQTNCVGFQIPDSEEYYDEE